MEKYVKLFEEFDRSEELEGFNFVKKIPTDEFMKMLRNASFEPKNYVYRLINYRPNSEVTWVMSGEIMRPIVKGDKKSVKVVGNNMYNSPFVVYPKSLIKRNYLFTKDEATGEYVRYMGKSKKIAETCTMADVAAFRGISFSAFFGNRTDGATISDSDYMKLVALLTDVFDNEKRHDSWIKSTRNYTGYIFDEVYVYEITDPEIAVDTLIEECDATVL